MSHEDQIRRMVQSLSAIFGQDVADSILSGRLTGTEAVPLVAGVLDGSMRQLLVPALTAKWETFSLADLLSDDPISHMSGTLTLLNGDKLKITVEVDDGTA